MEVNGEENKSSANRSCGTAALKVYHVLGTKAFIPISQMNTLRFSDSFGIKCQSQVCLDFIGFPLSLTMKSFSLINIRAQ